MAVVLTLPQTNVKQGAGAFTSPLIAAGTSQYIVTLNQIAWPFAGDTAFTYTVDQSSDSGLTWRSICTGNVSDVAGTVMFGVTLDDVGLATRKVRLSYNFAKALTISGTVQAL